MLQEALAHTRTAIADKEDVLATTQEFPQEDVLAPTQELSPAALVQIARNKAAAMEKKRLKAELEQAKTETCAVCHQIMFLDDYDQLQWLPCAHVYHRDCIQTWADTRNVTLELSCPVCKNTNLDVPRFISFEETVAASTSSASGSASGSNAAPMSAGEHAAISAATAQARDIL